MITPCFKQCWAPNHPSSPSLKTAWVNYQFSAHTRALSCFSLHLYPLPFVSPCLLPNIFSYSSHSHHSLSFHRSSIFHRLLLHACCVFLSFAAALADIKQTNMRFRGWWRAAAITSSLCARVCVCWGLLALLYMCCSVCVFICLESVFYYKCVCSYVRVYFVAPHAARLCRPATVVQFHFYGRQRCWR